MQHFASSSSNGTTITIAKGDTLTVVLHYETRLGQRTEWSFGDKFGYSPSLALGVVATDNGVCTMEFTAKEPGTVEIALDQIWVLGLNGPSNIKSKFRLKVTVL